jgi:hypothetical protein
VRLYFGLNDQHGLRVADGESSASFLEFHIPAAYPTVRGHQCSPIVVVAVHGWPCAVPSSKRFIFRRAASLRPEPAG